MIGRKSIGNSFNERLAHDKPNASDEIMHLANMGKAVGNNIKIRR